MSGKTMRAFALSLDAAIVVLCVSILMMAGFWGFQSYIREAKVSQAKADVATLAMAISRYAYNMETAHPNNTPAQCLPANLTTLEVKDTATGYGPWITGNALKKSGTSYLDPWGNAYVYTKGSGTDGRFVVYSKGADGKGSVTTDGTASAGGIGASGGYKS